MDEKEFEKEFLKGLGRLRGRQKGILKDLRGLQDQLRTFREDLISRLDALINAVNAYTAPD